MNTRNLIREIFSQPTAPFREGWVLAKIEEILLTQKIPYYLDPVGNIIAGTSSAKAFKTRARLGLMAHTDHPGFHIKRQLGPKEHLAHWFGGAPFKQMVGSTVRIHDPLNPHLNLPGQIIDFSFKNYRRTGIPFKIKLKTSVNLSNQCFGSFDFPGYSFRGNLVSTRAADDLAGCVIALGALLDLKKKNSGKTVAVFTRAEEVGFIGCWSFLKSHQFHKDFLMISLEASKALPAAEVGKGPVLRVGDAAGVFDPDSTFWVWQTALKLRKRKTDFKFQRKLMDGGTCEATALKLFKLAATGISVPLLNYHNQGISGPAAEAININDVHGARLLCAELGRQTHKPRKNMAPLVKKKLDENFNTLKKYLKDPIGYVR